jgi:membrane protein YdbS with pleckstrin-like domain
MDNLIDDERMAHHSTARRRAADARRRVPRRFLLASRRRHVTIRHPQPRRDAMSYVRKILEPGETVTHVTWPHWRVYVPAALLLILAIGALAASSFVTPDLAAVPQVAAAVLLLLMAASWLPAFIGRWTTELAVTNRRIIFKSGLIRRHTMEMSMSKVESVDVDQSILGRLLGYGTVTIRGTGGGIEPMRNIADPIAFRNHVTAGETVPAMPAAAPHG